MIRRLWLILAIGALGACTQAPAAPPAPAPQDTAAEEAKMRADLARWFDNVDLCLQATGGVDEARLLDADRELRVVEAKHLLELQRA